MSLRSAALTAYHSSRPWGRVFREIEELGSGPVRAEFWERPDCRHLRWVELGARKPHVPNRL
jgi:hypothetical protein